MENIDLYEQSKRFLKVELAKRGMNYAELAEQMTAKGYNVTANELRSKTFRGSFSFGFMMSVADTLGCEIRFVEQ